MTCPRCTGVMLPERFQDIKDDSGQISFYGWRCVSCGEILDPVIMRNRQRRPHTLRGGNKVLKSSFFTGKSN
jgi:hypothetical protein